jgi:hypothetical protein
MSRTTPRKSRHRHQSSGGGPRTVAASDYESDAAHYMEARDLRPPTQVPHRTNTELNLSVLRRYLPSIRSIVSIAANAVVYNISPAQSWEKSGVEGTLFVCEQEPAVVSGHPVPRACVFVLNRRGLDNLVVELCHASVCEVAGEFIIFNVENNPRVVGSNADPESGDDTRVIGIWIHADKHDTREVNIATIQDAWRQSRMVTARNALETPEEEVGRDDTGRRLSITELFGQSNGAQRR